MTRKSQKGVSLTELMVGVGISVTLLMVALPNLSSWVTNSKVRSAAQSINDGLQVARAEAVKRNASINFFLTDAKSSWNYGCVTATDDCKAKIESRNSAAENTNAVTINTNRTGIAFNGLGRQIPAKSFGGGAVNPVTTVTVNVYGDNDANGNNCKGQGGDVRCLRVIVTAGGQIRMCDPSLSGDTLTGC